MLIRSFIAIPIPQEMTNKLGDASAKMAYEDKSGAIRWVDQSNYHVTLAFLGDQHESDLEELAEQLDLHLLQTELVIAATHTSPFPESKPKLIAAMIEKSDSLLEVHRQVMVSVAASAIEIGKRRFAPHITLGRYRHSKNKFAGAISAGEKITAEIEEVAIYQSTLTSAGAEYEPIFRFPLADFEFNYEEQQ